MKRPQRYNEHPAEDTGASGLGGGDVDPEHELIYTGKWPFGDPLNPRPDADSPGVTELHVSPSTDGAGSIFDDMFPFKLQFIIDDDPESDTYKEQRLRIYTGMLTAMINTFTYSEDKDTDTTYDLEVQSYTGMICPPISYTEEYPESSASSYYTELGGQHDCPGGTIYTGSFWTHDAGAHNCEYESHTLSGYTSNTTATNIESGALSGRVTSSTTATNIESGALTSRVTSSSSGSINGTALTTQEANCEGSGSGSGSGTSHTHSITAHSHTANSHHHGIPDISAHNHTQNSHSHDIPDVAAHNHTQNSHSHDIPDIAAHNHTQNSHSHSYSIPVPTQSHDHPAHSHSVSTQSVTVPSHSHSSHKHEISAHSHKMGNHRHYTKGSSSGAKEICELDETETDVDKFLTIGGQPKIRGLEQIEPEGFVPILNALGQETEFRAQTLDDTYGKVWLTWDLDTTADLGGPADLVVANVKITMTPHVEDDPDTPDVDESDTDPENIKVGALTVANWEASRGPDVGTYYLLIGTTYDPSLEPPAGTAIEDLNIKSIVQVIYENVYYSPFILPENRAPAY